MSHVAILCHAYDEAVELFHFINYALIKVKKVQEGLPGAEAIAPQDLEESRRNLAQALSALGGQLKSRTGLAEATGACPRIPDAVVDRLRKRREADLGHYLQQMEETSARLRQQFRLTVEDIRLLDQLVAAANVETGYIFRQLTGI